MKLAIVYYSKTGHTKEMAEVIAKGMEQKVAEVRLFSIEEKVDVDYLKECQGVVFGTPTYYATSSCQLMEWLSQTDIDFAGKLGGCFATAHFAQGGSDTAILSVLGLLLVKGMLVYSGGSALGKPFIHHGPVALDAEENHFVLARPMFETFGQRFAKQAWQLQ